ncbi:MAG TPA: amidohydrolase family protein [Candidatus Acidoferrum sp.]|jgi:imidazolonepropionase-like amidohydrolase|nr:amidohydrolase family protein [Candidatus Acidoferrum sp.]
MDTFDCRCPHSGFSQRAFDAAKLMLGRRAFIAGAAAATASALIPWRARAAANEVTVLKSARLFDGTTMHTPGVLVIKGDRIVSMNAGDAGADAHVIELGDATLMPGLIDCHTHVAPFIVDSHYLVQPGHSADNIGEAAIYGLKNAQTMLHNGFTTVRDVGGGWGVDLAVRDAIAEGVYLGPQIFAAGPALSITGGHGDSNDLPDFVHEDEVIESGVSYGPYGFREVVREHVKRHTDLVKILATGGVLSYGDVWDIPQMNLDEIQAVVDESTKFNRKVAAHCHGDKGISIAVEGGVHSVEHCTGASEATLKNMQQRGTALVPTIWALDSILQPGNPNHIPPGSVQKAEYAATIRNEGMQRALGTTVIIAYGTDAGVFPHSQNNKDFALLVHMGMRPTDVMRSATLTAAELIGVNDRGTLAAGKRADVVAFNGDLSHDISLIEKPPALILLGGKRVNPA